MHLVTFGIEGPICQIDYNRDSLSICCASVIEDGVYYPTESVTLYTKETILKLATEILKVYGPDNATHFESVKDKCSAILDESTILSEKECEDIKEKIFRTLTQLEKDIC